MNAGEMGDELANLVCENIAAETSKTDRQIMTSRVIRALIDARLYAPPKAAPPTRAKPMSDSQARAFESTLAPFGKWEGKLIAEIPLPYLRNLCDPSGWVEEVKRYVDNPGIQQED